MSEKVTIKKTFSIQYSSDMAADMAKKNFEGGAAFRNMRALFPSMFDYGVTLEVTGIRSSTGTCGLTPMYRVDVDVVLSSYCEKNIHSWADECERRLELVNAVKYVRSGAEQ